MRTFILALAEKLAAMQMHRRTFLMTTAMLAASTVS